MAFAQRRKLTGVASLGWASARLRPMKCGKRNCPLLPKPDPYFPLSLRHPESLLVRVGNYLRVFPQPALDESDINHINYNCRAGRRRFGLRPAPGPATRVALRGWSKLIGICLLVRSTIRRTTRTGSAVILLQFFRQMAGRALPQPSGASRSSATSSVWLERPVLA